MTDSADRIAQLSPEKRALLMQRLKQKGDGARTPGLPRRPNPGEYPLSFAQQRLWFLDQLEPGSPFYNIAAALRLTGPLDVGALRRALGDVVRRHEVLRAYFVTEKGYPVQQIAPELALAVPLIDLRDRPEAEREAEARRLTDEEARRPFDLARGPLLRASLVRLDQAVHLLLLTLHHIVSDGWSVQVLVQELAALYAAHTRGVTAALPELPVQYADFAHWQREQLAGALREQQLAYWKAQLADLPPVLELPTDRPRPTVQTYRGARCSVSIPAAVADRLRALSRQESATLFMTLLAAYAVLLARYTGQDDLAIGIPVANRAPREVQGLIGFFVNTLVMRARLTAVEGGALSFRALLRQVRETVLAGQAHQDLPFELLLDALDVQRDMSRSPLFQTMFALQDSPLAGLSLGDLKLDLLEPDTGTAKFDLTLFIDERPGGLRGADMLRATFEYNTDLFDAATLERMSGHFLNLLASLAADPDGDVFTAPLLAEAERRQLLVNWNQTAFDYPRDACLPELFAAQAARRPDAVAVRYGEAQLTYGELDRRANQLAHWLQAQGVGPDQLVGLFMERSVDMVVAMLGIVKAGAAYLPLDIDYPRERLAFMLADGQAPVLLTQARLKDELPASHASVLCLDTDWPTLAGWPETAPRHAATPESLAYVIYTSGSTGVPKGVAVPQRAIVRLVFNTNYISLGPDDRIAQASNASFDAATFEVWGALLHGGQLIGVSKDVALSPRDFAAFIRDQGLTALFVTTALFNHLAASAPGLFQPLRTLMFGGEAADPRWVRQVLATGAPERLLNVYGPTETTTFATWYDTRRLGPEAVNVPIGLPIGNTTCHVLDRNLQLVPVGVPGELYIGGDGLARGYLNRPELTAEKFVPSPFLPPAAGGEPRGEGRLYKTGDRVRRLPGGDLEYLGRFDHQVKIRGFRIELGEIEAVLGRHPAVRELLVMVREDAAAGGEKRVVAYLVPHAGQAPTLAELRAYLRERLPEYMVPAAFVLLDAFPLNPNGKVDRQALPAPEQSGAASGRPFLAPRTPVEEFLAGLWREVLRLERVSVYDNFFEVGGDSIKAAVLTNRVQEALQVSAHVRAVFMAPTIAELATYLSEYYPGAVQRVFGAAAAPAEAAPLPPGLGEPVRRLDIADVLRLRQAIAPLPPRPAPPARRNPPAVFLLSPPRSGSTLLRVMLDGHPRLFAPPEMDLLSFNTLAERRATFTGESAFWLQGPVRALMAARGLEAEAAERLMEAFEREGLSVQEFYARLQSWIGDRLLVDKTPTYPLDPAILRRAEEDFDGALYIHLVRHPYSSIYSFIEAKLDQVFFRHPHTFSRRELAELVWIISHQNILDFLSGVPAERQIRVHFEELVTDPEAVTRRLCAFLKIEFDPALVRPYEGERMTDGVRPGAPMVGDFKFYLRKDIDANAADRWKKFHTVDFLSDVGRALAASLGYRLDDAAPATDGARPAFGELRPLPRDGSVPLPLSFAQQRLWFLDRLEPASPYYNVPAAVRFTGALDVATLERALNEIIRRHETLRATFETVDGQPVVRIAPERALRLAVTDLASRPHAEREAEAQRLARLEALQPFDLAQGPLVRGALFRLAADEHLFLLVLHHVVCDGWSVGVLTREVAALYTALSQGLSASLPPLPVQYADYAYWQRQWLQGEALQQQLAYWKRQLADAPAQLDLPTDRPRPALQSYRGARYTFALSQPLTQQVAAFSRAAGVTTFATLLAAFQALLHRYTGQDDLCTGTPVANRTRAEVEGLIGFFVNTLVIRTRFSADPSFRALVHQVAETALQAFAHQDVPFEMVVDAVRPARDLSRTPLFQVMFALQNTPAEPVRLPGLTITPTHVDGGTSKFDLTVFLQEREGELRGLVEYNTDLFDAATLARMMAHFRILLEAAVADPDRSVSALPLLTDAERRQLLVDWNRTARPVDLSRTVHERIAEQAARTPDRTAVVYEDAALTYAELDARAGRLARVLQAQGVGADSIVGLCLERSVDLIVGLLAIWKAGGAYLPLDPAYPPDRLAFMLQDSGASIVLTTSALTPLLPSASAQVIRLDMDWGARPQSPVTSPPPPATPDSLAYVIYTSGSTGKPKGVLIEHRSAVNLGEALQRVVYAPLGEGLRLSLNAPLSFDASVQHILLLMFGHTLCLVPQELRLEGDGLLAWIRRLRLDGLDCVPSQLKLLLAAGMLDGSGWAPRAVLPGGEAIDEALWKALAQAPATEFYNVYGPTECTCDSTIGHVRARPDRPVIGRPVDNVQLYVLDRRGQPVPVGVPGELYIGGVQVGRGYLNRPELTAERFLRVDTGQWSVTSRPAPRLTDPSTLTTLYKTGDLVRYLPDGNLEFLGRLDDQVKVRGFRIELGEIEAALKEHPGLSDAVVVAREDAPGAKRLVAYLRLADPAAPAPAGELRAFLKQRLPDYMLPAAFVTLEQFPLTPSGKVDRRALPTPDQDRPELESAFVGPRTPAEAALAAIWAQLLGVKQVGVRDNFFELGGDSILSIQVIARAAQAGLRLTPRQLFQHPTIEGLAAVAGQSPVVQAEQGPVTGPAPLTPIQRHFFAQGLPEPQHWNQAFLLEVRERLDPAALREAVAALLAHHDALRLRFRREADGWAAHMAPVEAEVPLAVEDLSALPDADLPAALEARCAAAQASLDLATGPLLRVVCFDCGPGRPDRLLVVVHHLAVDGVSWRILFEDLQTGYAQRRHGRAIALPPKTTSYSAWARRLLAEAGSATTLAELEFWQAQSAGARLPADHERGANDEASAREVRQEFSEAETRALLQDVHAAYGADVNDALLTALAQALSAWTGAPEAWVALESHGREDLFADVDLSRTVGWFTALYPLRLTGAGRHPGEALKAVKEQVRRAPRRGLGYGLLRYVAGALPEAAWPDLSFNYLGQFDQLLGEASAFRPARESAGPSRSPRSPRAHQVDVTGSIAGGRLQLAWLYSENRHRRETIERLAESFAQSLRNLIAHCQSPEAVGYTPSDFPDAGLGADDLEALLGEIGERT